MIEKLYNLKEVIEITGLSRSLIYNLVNSNEFPKPIKIAKRRIMWNEKSLSEWIKFKIQGRK